MARQDLVGMTISLTREDRRTLKRMALDRDTNVSALIREWMAEHSEAPASGSSADSPFPPLASP